MRNRVSVKYFYLGLVVITFKAGFLLFYIFSVIQVSLSLVICNIFLLLWKGSLNYEDTLFQ